MAKKILKCYKISGINQDEIDIMAYSPKEALQQLFPNVEFENVARGNQWYFFCGIDYDYRVTIPMKYNGPAYRYYKIKVQK